MRLVKLTAFGLACCFLVVLDCLPAAAERLVVQSWGSTEGLEHAGVRSLAQSGDGFVWVGTEFGLFRFDGAAFVGRAMCGLDDPRSHVWAMERGDRGEMWVAMEGQGVLLYQRGCFVQTPFLDLIGSAVVSTLLPFGRESCWVGTEDSGLIKLDRDSAVRVGDPTDPRTVSIRALAPRKEGGVWVGTRGSGLFWTEGERLIPATANGVLNRDEILALAYSPSGQLRVATRRGVFELKNEQYVPLQQDETPRLVLDMETDARGRFWEASSGSGVRVEYDGSTRTLGHEDGLPENDIRVLSRGNAGDLWVGSRTQGIARIHTAKIDALTDQTGLSGRVALPIFEDQEGYRWVGTYGQGLNRIGEGKIEVFGIESGLDDLRVLALAQTRDGRLWVGTRSGLFVRKDGLFERVASPAEAEPESLTVLFVDSRDVLWLGGPTGLKRRDRSTGQLLHTAGPLANAFILSMAERADGSLCVGTNGDGLFCQNGDTWDTWTIDEGLASDVVFAIHEDERGTLWVGTSKGLAWVRSRRAARVQSLLRVPVYRILDDGRGRFWLATAKGLWMVFKPSLDWSLRSASHQVEYRILSEADGVPHAECNGGIQPAGILCRDGSIWIPTMGGVAIVDPGRWDENGAPPPTRIDALTVAGQLPLHPDSRSPVMIGPEPSRVTIDFTGIDFDLGRELLFEHRLVGYDETWELPRNQRRASFTQLPSGRYRFEVRARRPGQRWQGPSSAVVFRVAPTFFQTWWFRVVVMLILLVAVIGASNYRVHRSRRLRRRLADENARLEACVADRTRDLEKTMGELKAFTYSVSHDLKAPIRHIASFVDLLLESESPRLSSKGRRYLDVIGQAAARMARIIDDLLEYSRVGQAPVFDEEIDLNDVMHEAIEALSPQVQAAGARVEWSDQGFRVRGDRTLLELIFTNLIGNSIKYRREGVRCSVVIAAEERNDTVVVSVRDNGVGIDREYHARIFEPFERLDAHDRTGSGIGLAIVKRAVDRLGGRVWLQSQLGGGTVFHVEMKKMPVPDRDNRPDSE